MNIHLYNKAAEASSAKGLTVGIDILRASTVEAYALRQGAAHIIPVATEDEALAIKKVHQDYLLIGEKYGLKIPGFDFGNSPEEVVSQNLEGKILIHKTTNGTVGLANAEKSTEVTDILCGSFVTFSALIRFIKHQNPSDISLIATDFEDMVFANFLTDTLYDKYPSFDKAKNTIEAHPNALQFLDPDKADFSKKDLELTFMLDSCDFICLAEKNADGQLILKKHLI